MYISAETNERVVDLVLSAISETQGTCISAETAERITVLG